MVSAHIEIKRIPFSRMKTAIYNPRQDLQPGDSAYDKLERSMEDSGYVDPIVWNETTGNIVGGHQRFKILQAAGLNEADVSVVHLSLEKEKILNLNLNKISGQFDEEKLGEIFREFESQNCFDFDAIGFDQDEIEKLLKPQLNERLTESHPSNLFNTFVVPPFSVLDTRQGYWQERKKQWLDFGIKSEVGRGDNLVFNKSLKICEKDNGTSIFDPVLCEIMYRWFNIPKGLIFDPFAGGSVRGIVARHLGFEYMGIDLRQEQVESNYKNAKEIGVDISALSWICDDSQNMDTYISDRTADMLFTCPPYFDLETYSSDKRDISNMSYDNFTAAFTNILDKSSNKLKENRFAVVVLSDVRDKAGYYRDLTGTVKKVFSAHGLNLYKDIILYNSIGSAALRARRNMNMRKTVRVHQNVMVFYNGNPQTIKRFYPKLKEISSERIAELSGE